ncbi:MAG: SWIM zinc finger family protein [Actinomycetota bacterium]|nr:SWIM zinc finger family protein [Actinomycetota bacterium]
MITTKDSAPAHPSTPTTIERIAAAVEAELMRLRAARPALASRISRAEGILITHLSCRRQRVIRVRVAGGRPRFLVSGSGGAVYVVDPGDWSCTCPDHHRRGGGCKHSIACWALWRSATARPASTPCASCGERLPRRELVEVGPAEAEWSLAVSEGDALCRPCARRAGVL